MERRLLRGIINPSMIVVWVLGLWMAWEAPWYDELWLQLKVALVRRYVGLHGFLVALHEGLRRRPQYALRKILSYNQ